MQHHLALRRLKMKFVVAFTCLVAVAVAAPQSDRDKNAKIVRDERVDNGDGSFSYLFASDNGIETEVQGRPGSEGQSNMQGYYLLPLESGGFARVEFVADESGFQPRSDVIPTPHPLPEHVHELLRIAERQRAEGITFD
ncbi:cuticle protein AMP2-like [Macrobrachium rosenbergii]|uniref:cuticle protein AMP2-like n=1 Tax=Macrobrachium rosenbergii TaxID=79674 RepID=UPI0034D44928